MQEHGQNARLVGIPRIGAQIPEIGVEGLVAGGAHESDQGPLGGANGQGPTASLQGLLPTFGRSDRFAAGAAQPVEFMGGRPGLADQLITVW